MLEILLGRREGKAEVSDKGDAPEAYYVRDGLAGRSGYILAVWVRRGDNT